MLRLPTKRELEAAKIGTHYSVLSRSRKPRSVRGGAGGHRWQGLTPRTPADDMESSLQKRLERLDGE
eukprot:SAG22_NODE_11861_length_466_cov_0.850136_1_plen_66_part_01